MKVLIGMTHMAAYQYASQLVSPLQNRGHHVAFCAEGKALDSLRTEDSTVDFYEDPHRTLEGFRPNVVVACIAGFDNIGSIEYTLAREANQCGIPWACCEDTEGVVSRPVIRAFVEQFPPVAMCFTDEYSVARFRGKSAVKAHLVVVGNPTWDGIAKADRNRIGQRTYQQLNLAGEKVVLYLPAKGVERVRESLRPLCNALRGFADALLIPLFHPADEQWRATLVSGESPFGCYGEDLQGLHVLSRSDVESAIGKDMVPLLAVASVVVSPTSSEVTRACLIGTPVIRPLFPLDRKFLEDGGYEAPHYFSDVALGASIGARTETELTAALEVLWGGHGETITRSRMLSAKQEHFKGRAGECAQRVVEAIEAVLRP